MKHLKYFESAEDTFQKIVSTVEKWLGMAWDASAINQIINSPFWDHESGRIISDAGREYLDKMDNLSNLYWKARAELDKNPDSDQHKEVVKRLESEYDKHMNSTTTDGF